MNLPIESARKICFNKRADRLYIIEDYLASVFAVANGRSLTMLTSREFKSPVFAIHKGKNEEMLICYRNSNDLSLIGQDLLEIESLPGEFDSPTVRADKASDGFGHSLDDHFILWVKGGKGLSVVSKKQFLPVNEIGDFFSYKGEPTKPVSGCATRDASKIFGISEDTATNRQIAHFYQTEQGSERLKHSKISKLFP